MTIKEGVLASQSYWLDVLPVQAMRSAQEGQTLMLGVGTKIEKCMVYWGCLQLVNAALAFRDFQIYLENFGVLLSKKAIMF